MTKRSVALVLAAGAVVAGLATSAFAKPSPRRHTDAPLVAAFEQVDQNSTWTLSRTIEPTWIPNGDDWEQEGFKYYDGRFYISAFDQTDKRGHLVVLRHDGSLIKDISFADGERQHAGGIDVYGHEAYVPLAVDSPHSSADILAIDTRTFRVRTLFTVGYDHVGGLTYDPVRKLLVGQDWDSRTFYEWSLRGKRLAMWRNPNDYVGYQDCQYVPYEKLLCSASPLGTQTQRGFDLIDLVDAHHALLNGVPQPAARGGNANELFARRVPGGTEVLDYDASPGPIEVFATTVPSRRS